MRRGLLLAALGLLLLMVQGALARFVPMQYAPDLGFLLVVALASRLRSAALGVFVAAWVGLATDILSGSLLGEHVLMRLAVFGAARFAARRLNLRGSLPQAIFVAFLSVAEAVSLWALASFFSADVSLEMMSAGVILPHALVQALFTPPMAAFVNWLLIRFGDDDATAGVLRLATRSFPQ